MRYDDGRRFVPLLYLVNQVVDLDTGYRVEASRWFISPFSSDRRLTEISFSVSYILGASVSPAIDALINNSSVRLVDEAPFNLHCEIHERG